MSSTSFLFFSGRITFFILFRWAAMHFSLMPPTGRINPCKEISPVMAKSERTRRYVRRETRAVVIVTPALGPSFGTAAAGKWTWMSNSLKNYSVVFNSFERTKGSSATATLIFLKGILIPILPAFDFIQLKPVFTDSFITSPSFPVNVKWPLPGNFVDSISKALPPTSVYASPYKFSHNSKYNGSSWPCDSFLEIHVELGITESIMQNLLVNY